MSQDYRPTAADFLDTDILSHVRRGGPLGPCTYPAPQVRGEFVVQSQEGQIIDLLEEIRDTLQGRRGFLAIPSAVECAKYGAKVVR